MRRGRAGCQAVRRARPYRGVPLPAAEPAGCPDRRTSDVSATAMIPYIARRIVQAIFVVLGVTIIVFIILRLLPGGPARALLGPRATNQQVQDFIVANGYNKPVWIQYGTYLSHLIHGNLGFSYHYNQTVNSLLAQDLPKTAVLVGLSYLISIAVAIPLGILQAVRRNKPIDYGLTGLSFIGHSMPVFLPGLLLFLLF